MNKAKLFNSKFGRIGQVFGAKVIMVLMDYLLKMENILKEMKVMFTSLQLEAPIQPIINTRLEVLPNIFVNLEVLPSLE